jgi:hypothetical protein
MKTTKSSRAHFVFSEIDLCCVCVSFCWDSGGENLLNDDAENLGGVNNKDGSEWPFGKQYAMLPFSAARRLEEILSQNQAG